MSSVAVRLATRHDTKSLLDIPPYSDCAVAFPTKEEILIAEKDGKILGAISIGHKNIRYVPKGWKKRHVRSPNSQVKEISGCWISKLYVFPEHRCEGIGTKLLKETIKYLKEKGVSEAYAGIYIKNKFRKASHHIFEKNGFEDFGSCICSLSEGYCRGILLSRIIKSSVEVCSGSMNLKKVVNPTMPPYEGGYKKLLISPLESVNSSVTEAEGHAAMEHKLKQLTDEIRTLSIETGADLVGFTSAKRLEEGAPKGHRPSDLMSDAKSAIILACGRRLNEFREYSYKWGPDFSSTFIKLKDEIKHLRREAGRSIEAVKNFLNREELRVTIEPHGWTGVLSFKMVAYLAGLGAFGKGDFIVHPRLGPINILACILTNASLDYGTPLKIDVCGDCIECIRACKYGAFKKTNKGYKWIPEKCRSYDLIMNPVTLKWTYGPCNSKCVNVCPIGK